MSPLTISLTSPSPQALEVINTNTHSNIIGKFNSKEFEEKIYQALQYAKDDKLFDAARLLKEVELKQPNLIQNNPYCNTILSQAKLCQDRINEIEKDTTNNKLWKKSKDKFNNQEIHVHYNIYKEQVQCKIHSKIEKSLLRPLLSVLNETDLYHTWLPNWNTPRFKIRQSTKLHQVSRVSQLVKLLVDVPWPLDARELIINARAFDHVHDKHEICIMIDGIDKLDGNEFLQEFIPPKENPKNKRVEFEGFFLFRPDLQNKNLVEASLYITYDTFSSSDTTTKLPEPFLHFLLKIAAAKMWKRFLKVAQEVRDGKRPQHSKAIAMKKHELYDWIDERIAQM